MTQDSETRQPTTAAGARGGRQGRFSGAFASHGSCDAFRHCMLDLAHLKCWHRDDTRRRRRGRHQRIGTGRRSRCRSRTDDDGRVHGFSHAIQGPRHRLRTTAGVGHRGTRTRPTGRNGSSTVRNLFLADFRLVRRAAACRYPVSKPIRSGTRYADGDGGRGKRHGCVASGMACIGAERRRDARSDLACQQSLQAAKWLTSRNG